AKRCNTERHRAAPADRVYPWRCSQMSLPPRGQRGLTPKTESRVAVDNNFGRFFVRSTPLASARSTEENDSAGQPLEFCAERTLQSQQGFVHLIDAKLPAELFLSQSRIHQNDAAGPISIDFFDGFQEWSPAKLDDAALPL